MVSVKLATVCAYSNCASKSHVPGVDMVTLRNCYRFPVLLIQDGEVALFITIPPFAVNDVARIGALNEREGPMSLTY